MRHQLLRQLFILSILVFTGYASYCQSAAINTDGSSAVASAALDIKSTTKGLLVPRMLASERILIGSPAEGLLVYQTDATAGFYFYKAGVWTSMTAGSTGWSLTGNAGTVDGTDFIGTTDNVPFNLRVNNQNAGRIDPALRNTFFGYQAGNSNGTGVNNTANGLQSLFSNTTGNHNTANGTSALVNNSVGNNNTANGQSALFTNTTGSSNTANGYNALTNNATGNSNTADGYLALHSNTVGSNNTALGSNANVSLGSLFNATAIGAFAVVNATNKIRLGSAGVTVIEGQVAYTFPSDGRFKTNISESDVRGIDFINRLRPVVYNFDTKKFEGFLTNHMPDSVRQRYMKSDFTASNGIRQSGFIAQEVEKAAVASGYNFNGVHKPDNDNDHYSLAYSLFVVPLVKAVQEQQQMIDKQQVQMNKQQEEIEGLKKLVAGIVKDKQ